MSDEIKQRLKECADTCLKSYEAWDGNRKDEKARESLMEAVHELRKVSSRLEIELAVSDRAETTKNKIPIPAHRDARGRNLNDDDDNFGNGNSGPKSGGGKPRRRNNNNGPKKSSGGEG